MLVRAADIRVGDRVITREPNAGTFCRMVTGLRLLDWPVDHVAVELENEPDMPFTTDVVTVAADTEITVSR